MLKLKEGIQTKNFFLRLSLGVLFFFIFYMYFVFLPVDYNFDGTVFSNFLRYALLKNSVQPVLSPHHLLYHPFCFFTYKIIMAITGSQMLEYYFLQLVSLSFGLLTLIMLYRVFAALAVDVFYRLSGLFLVAFSFLFWLYSVESEVHMPGFFFMVAGSYFLFFKPHHLELKYLGLAALLFSLSAGFHLTNGLIVFSILAFFIYKKSGLKKMIQFYSIYGLCLSLPYLVLKILTGINFFSWIKDVMTGTSAFAGYSTIGTQFSTWRRLSLDSVSDSLGAVRDSILKNSADSTVLSMISILIPVFILFVSVYLFLRKSKIVSPDSSNLPSKPGHASQSHRAVLVPLFFWLVPFFIFFTFWQPGNYEFKLNTAVPLLLAGVFSFSRLPHQKVFKPLFVAICLTVFLGNFSTAIEPLHHIERNGNYLLAKSIGDKTPENAIVVIAGMGKKCYLHGKIYIPYFGMREVLILDWRLGKGFTFEQIATELERKMKAGQPVYFLSEVSSLSETMRDLLRFHKLEETSFDHFLNHFPARERIELVNGYSLEKITATTHINQDIFP